MKTRTMSWSEAIGEWLDMESKSGTHGSAEKEMADAAADLCSRESVSYLCGELKEKRQMRPGPPMRHALEHYYGKKSAKRLQDPKKNAIFASSKLISGQNAADPEVSAVFVPSPYRKNNTTATAWGMGNHPKALANKCLTARSAVSLLSKLISMKATRTMSLSESLQEWLDAESKSFSAIAGESFTHGEVIMTGAFSLCLVPCICLLTYIATWLAGGAA